MTKSWYYLVAGAVLVLTAVVFIVYQQEPSRAQLEARGWKVEGKGDGALLTYHGVPGPESINILRRVRVHFTIKLITFEIDKDISGWASLKGLIGLDLSSTKIRDLDRLKNLKNLTTLNASHNSFLTDISALQNLTNLNTLDLSYTDVHDMTPLKNLKGLRALYLSGTGISDLRPLRDLRNLTNLYLDSTRITDINLLPNLQNLDGLSLASDRIADWGPLKDLPNLLELDLSSSNMSDVTPLKNLKKLQSLSLRFTWVDQASIAELRHSLPNALIVP